MFTVSDIVVLLPPPLLLLLLILIRCLGLPILHNFNRIETHLPQKAAQTRTQEQKKEKGRNLIRGNKRKGIREKKKNPRNLILARRRSKIHLLGEKGG
jgi:hypothetical protein